MATKWYGTAAERGEWGKVEAAAAAAGRTAYGTPEYSAAVARYEGTRAAYWAAREAATGEKPGYWKVREG